MSETRCNVESVVSRMEKQYEEERLQRLVQEEAVKFLWKEVNNYCIYD